MQRINITNKPLKDAEKLLVALQKFYEDVHYKTIAGSNYIEFDIRRKKQF